MKKLIMLLVLCLVVLTVSSCRISITHDDCKVSNSEIIVDGYHLTKYEFIDPSGHTMWMYCYSIADCGRMGITHSPDCPKCKQSSNLSSFSY